MIVYPRHCKSCHRSYLNRSSFCNHRKKCAEYTAELVMETEKKEEALSKLRSVRAYKKPSAVELVDETIQSAEILAIPVPDAIARARYISNKATFYVVQTAHSFNCGLNVYKVGRTIDMNSRMRGYPKGSIAILQLLCRDAESFEQHMIASLMQADDFRHRPDFGTEYFEGSLASILDLTMKEYHRTGMSPAHLPSSDTINEEDAMEAVKEVGPITAAIEIEREYQKMMLEKKLIAIAKHKRQQRDEALDDVLLSLYTKLRAPQGTDEPVSECDAVSEPAKEEPVKISHDGNTLNGPHDHV